MLLAPAVGLATTLLPVFAANRAGVPVERFGPLLAAVLLLASLGLHWRLRPTIQLRAYLPFAAVFLLALVLTGRPMLALGFDWLSYSNEDMANYSLAAHRFLNQGFFDVPDPDALIGGRDYSLFYWLMHVVDGQRPGSELLLAWVVSLSGLTAHQVFMPVILALHLALISAAGALVCQSRRLRLAAVLTCGLLSLSALTTLGTLYQLIAQVGGLALLSGCATLVLRPFTSLQLRLAVRHGMLIGLLVSALLMMYPEVAPFLGLAFVLYTLVGVVQRSVMPRSQLIALGIGAVSSALLLNTYTVNAVLFLLFEITLGMKPSDVQSPLFPYSLVPSGLANLWGLQGLASLPPEPWLSVSIALGGLLLLAAAGASARLLWRRQPAGACTVAMLLVGARLFSERADFGLFKLGMYIQPFLLATVVIAWLGATRRPVARMAPLVGLGLAGLYAQTFYVAQSGGAGFGVFADAASTPQPGISAELRQIIASNRRQHIVSDTANAFIAKLEALHSLGIDTEYPSGFFFCIITACYTEDILSEHGFDIHQDNPRYIPGTITDNIGLTATLNKALIPGLFSLITDDNLPRTNSFIVNTIGQQHTINADCGLLLASTRRQTVFNRQVAALDGGRNFVALPCIDVRNYLIFVNSQLGHNYYGGEEPHIGVYQLEADPLVNRGTMAGVGRNLLFQVVNPTPGARLVLDLTASLKADGENSLPPAAAIGTTRQAFPVLGRGSARLFSPPLSPQEIAGRSYLGIDMGADGQRIPEVRSGLMALYGTDIPLDRRELVGFARDISLISEQNYAELSPPSKLDGFPADLAHPDLEYSGVYEDGWVSEAAFFELDQPGTSGYVGVRGEVPLIGDRSFHSELRVLVSGQEVALKALTLGEFRLLAPVPPGSGRRRVELRFSNLQRLPGGDNRPVAALLRSVGFEAGSGSASGSQPNLGAPTP